MEYIKSYCTFLSPPPFVSCNYESHLATLITVFFTVKIYVPVNTHFSPVHHSRNTSDANPEFLFSLEPTLPAQRPECVRQVWGTERHLPPWVPVSCQTFHTAPALLPPCPFYFSFLPPSREPQANILSLCLHQNYCCSPPFPGTMLCNFCISLPWLMFLYPQLLQGSSCGKGKTRAPLQNFASKHSFTQNQSRSFSRHPC